MVYFVRHGLTEWCLPNKETGEGPKCKGQTHDVDLAPEGIQQGKDLVLDGGELNGIEYDVVFCSPAKRTKRTCREILGLENEEDFNKLVESGYIILEPRLLERKMGDFEGTQMNAEKFEEFKKMWDTENELKADNIETNREMENRTHGILKEIEEKYPGKNVLILSHGGTGNYVTSYYEGPPKSKNYLEYDMKNGAVKTFDNTRKQKLQDGKVQGLDKSH